MEQGSEPAQGTTLENSSVQDVGANSNVTKMRDILTVCLGDKWPEEVKSCVTKVEYHLPK
jgi:hypothetical protein